MPTEVPPKQLEFQGLGRRQVVARFDGGSLSSDGGGLLLREVDQAVRILGRFADCFVDYRRPELIEHSVSELVSQRVYGLALGYEDLNDHDTLRSDPMLALMVGDSDPTGGDRRRKSDRGKALAGKSTLNRLEARPRRTGPGARYKKITLRRRRRSTSCWWTLFIEGARARPSRSCWTWMPPMIRSTAEAGGSVLPWLLPALLLSAAVRVLWRAPAVRPAASVEHRCRGGHGGGVGTDRQPDPIGALAEVQIMVRGDSGFCREELMSWCEAHGVDYVLEWRRTSV